MSIATTVAQDVRCSVSKTSRSSSASVELALACGVSALCERAHRVDAVELVAELVGAGLGQALDALAGGADRVVARRRPLRRRAKISSKALAPDAALAAGGELQRALAVALDELLGPRAPAKKASRSTSSSM